MHLKPPEPSGQCRRSCPWLLIICTIAWLTFDSRTELANDLRGACNLARVDNMPMLHSRQARSAAAQPFRAQCFRVAHPQRRQTPRQRQMSCKAIEIDWSDPDTWLAVLSLVGGMFFGAAVPAFFDSRAAKDEESLEEIRRMNREQYAETGQYMSRVRCPPPCDCCCQPQPLVMQSCFARAPIMSSPHTLVGRCKICRACHKVVCCSRLCT